MNSMKGKKKDNVRIQHLLFSILTSALEFKHAKQSLKKKETI